MASLLIKDIPESLRLKIKRLAKEHRRSMNQEAIYVLENAVGGQFGPQIASAPERDLDWSGPLPEPVKIKKPFTSEFINKAKREGRP